MLQLDRKPWGHGWSPSPSDVAPVAPIDGCDGCDGWGHEVLRGCHSACSAEEPQQRRRLDLGGLTH